MALLFVRVGNLIGSAMSGFVGVITLGSSSDTRIDVSSNTRVTVGGDTRVTV